MAQPAVAQQNVQHVSTNWPGGQQQETTSWCFAAASAIVHAAFGDGLTQSEIAHMSLMTLGESGAHANAVRYREAVQTLWATHELADDSWASVRTRVQQSTELMGYLRHTWGAPQLGDLPAVGGGRLTEQQMIDTLNANGLILAGNAAHYMVINAWRHQNGVLNFRRYDPMDGSNDWVDADEAREVDTDDDLVLTWRVTG